MVDRVLAHIRKQGYFIVDKDPDTATLAAHPRIAKVTTRGGRAERGVADRSRRSRRRGSSPTRCDRAGRTAGAHPHARRRRARQVRSSTRFTCRRVGLSLANYDDNQHTDNENLRLGNLWNGIRDAGVRS